MTNVKTNEGASTSDCWQLQADRDYGKLSQYEVNVIDGHTVFKNIQAVQHTVVQLIHGVQQQTNI